MGMKVPVWMSVSQAGYSIGQGLSFRISPLIRFPCATQGYLSNRSPRDMMAIRNITLFIILPD